jgi:hypothetical protein
MRSKQEHFNQIRLASSLLGMINEWLRRARNVALAENFFAPPKLGDAKTHGNENGGPG